MLQLTVATVVKVTAETDLCDTLMPGLTDPCCGLTGTTTWPLARRGGSRSGVEAIAGAWMTDLREGTWPEFAEQTIIKLTQAAQAWATISMHRLYKSNSETATRVCTPFQTGFGSCHCVFFCVYVRVCLHSSAPVPACACTVCLHASAPLCSCACACRSTRVCQLPRLPPRLAVVRWIQLVCHHMLRWEGTLK